MTDIEKFYYIVGRVLLFDFTPEMFEIVHQIEEFINWEFIRLLLIYKPTEKEFIHGQIKNESFINQVRNSLIKESLQFRSKYYEHQRR